MKIALVCNFLPDGQESMLRFSGLLRQALQHRGCEISEIRPSPILTRWTGAVASPRISKWFGYVDKYILFPPRLDRWVRSAGSAGASCIHVVDHSNAVYVPTSSALPWVVTCHDLLAVRGALGEDTDCPASRLGRRLQRAIVAGLSRAAAVACVSTNTLQDLERIVNTSRQQQRRMILLATNHAYRRIAREQALARLRSRPGIPWDSLF